MVRSFKEDSKAEMADVRRRKATAQELEQGQEEIRLADARFRKEAVERGEKARWTRKRD